METTEYSLWQKKKKPKRSSYEVWVGFLSTLRWTWKEMGSLIVPSEDDIGFDGLTGMSHGQSFQKTCSFLNENEPWVVRLQISFESKDARRMPHASSF